MPSPGTASGASRETRRREHVEGYAAPLEPLVAELVRAKGVGHKMDAAPRGRTHMPTYDYRCDRCGPFQALRSIAQRDAESLCPACSAVAARILSGSPHVGGVRRTLAAQDQGPAGAYARM